MKKIDLGGDPVRPHPHRHRLWQNFDYMPELLWRLGCPFPAFLMAMASIVIYLAFKTPPWI